MALIRFEDVDLCYPLRNHKGISLKEFVVRRFRREKIALVQEIKALKNVGFQIGDGERLGIIGFNGAGKSTLLRTIAGVYPASRGIADVRGSICSLFDIHLGFEVEATGEENIRYRLLLQGEHPSDIKPKVAPIIDFAEVGDFIKLPLRCYSTGMVMRLAFAIATSSNPEILLVDEVFSAGDLAFQHKAQQRMRDFLRRAKIVVMVGHNLDFLKDFCTRILWLDQGSVRMDGPPRMVAQAYMAAAASKAHLTGVPGGNAPEVVSLPLAS
jgi:lipopolysaccharide transport system ATP-binding protein